VVSTGSVLQVVLGLAAVLAMVAGSAWLLRRLGMRAGTAGGRLRLLGGVALGPRERALLLEVRETWLVVGVAPGQVRTLYSMPRPEDEPLAHDEPAAPGFALWLKRTLAKHRG
jgi:flagellar protein FliO/FliZ